MELDLVRDTLEVALEDGWEAARIFLFSVGQEAAFCDNRIQQTLQDFWGFPPKFRQSDLPLLSRFLALPNHPLYPSICQIAERSLMKAISLRDEKLTDSLAGSGLNLDFLAETNFSPLMLAAKLDNTRAVRILIEKGASLGFRNSADRSATGIAYMYRSTASRHILELAKAFPKPVSSTMSVEMYLKPCQ